MDEFASTSSRETGIMATKIRAVCCERQVVPLNYQETEKRKSINRVNFGER
jgi:hypothetical protein